MTWIAGTRNSVGVIGLTISILAGSACAQGVPIQPPYYGPPPYYAPYGMQPSRNPQFPPPMIDYRQLRKEITADEARVLHYVYMYNGKEDTQAVARAFQTTAEIAAHWVDRLKKMQYIEGEGSTRIITTLSVTPDGTGYLLRNGIVRP